MDPAKELEHYWELVKQLTVYSQYCVESDVQAPICRDFWIWFIGLMFAIAAVVSFFMAKTVIRNKILISRHKKWLAAQAAVADPDTMNEHLWIGDDTVDVNMTEEEMAAEIKKKLRTKDRLPTING